MEIREKFLPIGTVVLLKGGKQKIMITGFCTITDSNKDKMWDYSGCAYPVGLLRSNQTLLFDHEQIEEICHMGLQNEEEKEFKEKLLLLINNQIF